MRLSPLLLLVACGPTAPGDVPVTDAELTEWTAAGEYLRWTQEPEIHDQLTVPQTSTPPMAVHSDGNPLTSSFAIHCVYSA